MHNRRWAQALYLLCLLAHVLGLTVCIAALSQMSKMGLRLSDQKGCSHLPIFPKKCHTALNIFNWAMLPILCLYDLSRKR